MKLIITGAAGFIGSRVAEVLEKSGFDVLGIDNLNDYYNPALKLARLERCGFRFDEAGVQEGVEYTSTTSPGLRFIKMDASSQEALELIGKELPEAILHFAAQPGVRYSMDNARECLESNVLLFTNIIEACRKFRIPKLLYASSSSVYGNQPPHSFIETDSVDKPLSVYAVSKRTNEMLAEVYSQMYGFKAIGLRFFSVYGEWGRPDMAPMIFADAISNGGIIKLYNGGLLSRDFTYIDDVAECVLRILVGGRGLKTSEASHDVINIGHGEPVMIADFVKLLEMQLGRKANICYLPMQPGEASATLCNSTKMKMRYGYSPRTDITTGVARFVDWYKGYADKLRQAVEIPPFSEQI